MIHLKALYIKSNLKTMNSDDSQQWKKKIKLRVLKKEAEKVREKVLIHKC